MQTGLNQIKDNAFYKVLFSKSALPIIITFGIGFLYVILMSIIDHSAFPFPLFVLISALIKTFVISATTLRQLAKLMNICHSMGQLLWVFGLIITTTIVSFATDYTCLFQFDHTSFSGIPLHSDNYISHLFHFIYFSVTVFSTVGFGDIAPISSIARFVVVLEIFLSFFIIVFAFANIKKVHIED